MAKTKFLAPMIAMALALSATPVMAEPLQPSTTITTQPGIIAILIGLLLPAVQKVR